FYTEALHVVGIAAAHRDDLAAAQKSVRHRDRLVEQAAGIVAEIEDEALELVRRNLSRQIADGARHLVSRVFIELGEADIADVAALNAGSHRPHTNGFACQLDVDRLRLVLACDLEPYLASGRPA